MEQLSTSLSLTSWSPAFLARFAVLFGCSFALPSQIWPDIWVLDRSTGRKAYVHYEEVWSGDWFCKCCDLTVTIFWNTRPSLSHATPHFRHLHNEWVFQQKDPPSLPTQPLNVYEGLWHFIWASLLPHFAVTSESQKGYVTCPGSLSCLKNTVRAGSWCVGCPSLLFL
jgi:hypothetical protein